MNLDTQEYYDELYRIFAQPNVLLSVTQTALLGDCMRSLLAGENITAKLEKLYTAIENIPRIAEPLDNFMHQYNSFVEGADITVTDTDQALSANKQHKEVQSYDYKNTQPFTGYKFTGTF